MRFAVQNADRYADLCTFVLPRTNEDTERRISFQRPSAAHDSNINCRRIIALLFLKDVKLNVDGIQETNIVKKTENENFTTDLRYVHRSRRDGKRRMNIQRPGNEKSLHISFVWMTPVQYILAPIAFNSIIFQKTNALENLGHTNRLACNPRQVMNKGHSSQMMYSGQK